MIWGFNNNYRSYIGSFFIEREHQFKNFNEELFCRFIREFFDPQKMNPSMCVRVCVWRVGA